MLDNPAEVKSQFHENPPNVYGYGHTPLYENVIHAIETDTPPYVDARAGKRALELVLAIYQSAATGEMVRFPLEDCDTIRFKGRFEA